MEREKVIFWDVDTQYDFMDSRGRLYVRGAEGIIVKVSQVRRFALENGFSIIASTDWHSAGNSEISDSPDFETTFPPHCLAGTAGAERVGFLGLLPIIALDAEPVAPGQLREFVRHRPFHIVLRKNSLDVFSNPNTEELVRLVEPRSILVFGVALDFCVQMVVKELLRKTRAGIIVIADAVKGLGTRPDERIFAALEQRGTRVNNFRQICSDLLAAAGL